MNAFQLTEYGKLRKVLLCKPEHFKILEPINVIQEKNFNKHIDYQRVCLEHKKFVQALENENVEVILAETHKRYPYQVNTRDLGVTTPKGIVFGRFNTPYRWGEHRLLDSVFQEKSIYIYQHLTKGNFEGGDFVYLDHQTAAVGIGLRTDMLGIKQLEVILNEVGIEIIPVDFPRKYLHLDMIMNVIGEKTAILCKEALPKEFIEQLVKRDFTLINVSEKDVFLHKCNLLNIGNDTIISHTQAYDINKKLSKLGFRIIELDLKEILKSGGGPRCMSFPILREV